MGGLITALAGMALRCMCDKKFNVVVSSFKFRFNQPFICVQGIMHLAFASLWVASQDTPWEPRGNGTVSVFLLFPVKEGSCLVLETTWLDHRNIPTGFV